MSVAPVAARRRHSRRGAEVVEFGFVMIPLLAFMFLIMDISWMVFTRMVLQYAAREGCRYGITSRDASGNDVTDGAVLTPLIRQKVKAFSFGLITNITDTGQVKVQYLNPNNGYAPETNTAAQTTAGYVLKVTVSGVTMKPILPLFYVGTSSQSITMEAVSADRMEPHTTIF